jgi:predicted RNA-binding Zn ribbon-like protein
VERIQINSFAIRVDGLVLPAPLGGHPALDFCNTLAGWDDPEPGDYLKSYDHLVAWAAAWGLVDEAVARELRDLAAARPAAARFALEAARRFRESLYRVLTDPRPGADLEVVAEEARRAASVAELAVRDGAARWTLPASAGLRVPVYAVARAGAELITSAGASAVHRCPGAGCGWLFLDRSGRRRWCTMATCGNRAKVRRFAERHRPAVPRTAGPGSRRVRGSRTSATARGRP